MKKNQVTTKKVRVIFDLDTETGQYDLEYQNLSEPGKRMDYNLIRAMLKLVFSDFDSKITITKDKN